MLTPRTRTLLIGGLAILGGAGALFAWISFIRGPQEPPAEPIPAALENSAPSAGLQPSGSTQPALPSGDAQIPSAAEPAAPAQDDRTLLIGLSASFAERYGTYSTETDFANLRDLRPQMTARLAAATDAYIAGERAKGAAASYSGATTRSLNAEISAHDAAAGTAEAKVLVQRQRLTAADLAGSVSYETVLLRLVREDGTWKADSIATQPAQ